MGPKLEQLSVQNFRNHENFQISDIQGNLILVGANGRGKTNLIEAIQLAGTLESFRSSAWGDLIKLGSTWTRVDARFGLPDAFLETRLEVDAGGAVFYFNGKKKRRQDIEYRIPMVSFVPDDLQLLKGAAEQRRRYVDGLGKQLSSNYRHLVRDYLKIVQQRNAFLKDLKGCDLKPSLSEEVWNDHLADLGAALLYSRLHLFQELILQARDYYRDLSAGDELDACYYPSYLRGRDDDQTTLTTICSVDFSIQTKEEYKVELLKALARRRQDEYLRGVTLVGPHRDELDLISNKKEARRFASQGQQRSMILALKFAELRILAVARETEAILLLDDVLSELDSGRRQRLLEICNGAAQTLMTTTDLATLPAAVLESCRVIELI